MGVTIDEITEEVSTKMKQDDDFAESVVKAIHEDSELSDQMAKAMTKESALTEKVTEHLLSDDADLLAKVRGELEAEGFRLESGESQGEYTKDRAMRDFQMLAKSVKHEEDPAKIAKACGAEVSKVMEETDFSNAGVLIPEPLLDEIIPILTASSVFMDAGPVVVEMGQNKIGIGRQNQDPTASWQDESSTISDSDADFDKLQLDGKKLTVAMKVSNDFLRRDAIIADEDFLADRMMVTMMNKLESAFFRGSGTNYQPVGIYNRVDSAHKNSSSGNSITSISTDLREAVRQLESSDVPENRRAWFMRKEVFVDWAFDINSNEDTFPFREELVENGTLFGDETYLTNNIEVRSSGSDSDIYYTEMSEQYVGRGTDFTLDSSEHADFLDDQTVLKMIGHFDFEMKHTKSASVIENYTLQT